MTAEAASERLARSRRAVALTGAGMSTESGLPDFRSSGGLWGRWDPQEVATVRALRAAPNRFYAFYRERLAALAKAQPNEGHYALAHLERWGALETIITQNVDGLHQGAGSQHVVELHGNLREAACIDCGAMRPIAAISDALARDALPRCPHCSGLLKPNVVLFEELLPAAAYAEAQDACRRCDVMLVVGSSLQVTPAAWLPGLAQAHGAAVIIINDEPTPFDPQATIVIRGRAATVLPEIARALKGSAQQRESFPSRRKQSPR